MRWRTSLLVLVLAAPVLVLQGAGAKSSYATGTVTRSPSAAAPGGLITVRSDVACAVPAGDGGSVSVHLVDPDRDPGLISFAAVSVGVDGGSFSDPDYRAPFDEGGVVEEDGTWSVELFVPYGTPPGVYEVRARCSTGDQLEIVVVDYDAEPFTVSPWPTVPPTRTDVRPYGVVVDREGAVHTWGFPGPFGFGEVEADPRWPGRSLARGIAYTAVGFTGGVALGGLEVDAHGGLHRLGTLLPEPHGGTYWPGWDIARGVALHMGWGASGPSGGGVVVDGWGGLHPFGLGDGAAPTVTPGTGPYWPGWDIARDVVITPDGRGGYVLDAWGALHPFGLNGNPPPPKPKWNPYWPGWDIAWGVSIMETQEGLGGYILDAWGAAHPFSVGGEFLLPAAPGPYWPGEYVAHGLAIVGNWIPIE